MRSGYAYLLTALFVLPAEAASPCRDDIIEHCGEVRRGAGRISQCIAANREKFSAECQAAMQRAREDVEALTMACRDDRERFCSDIAPGRGRILSCLRERREELSPVCLEETDRVSAEWGGS